MGSYMQIFKNEQFGEVRMIEENGKPLFCGSDVARALGYARPNDAIVDHCRCTVKRRIPHPQSPDKEIGMAFIPEGDVYRLIVRSKLPAADKFERWVFDEVIPSIRKTGGYIAGQETMSDVELMARALIVAQNVIEEKNRQISGLTEENLLMKPKAEYFDDLVDRKLLTNFRDTAKEFHLGQKRFIAFLTDNGYAYRDAKGRILPHQKHVDAGLFELKECRSERSRWAGMQTLITPRGRETFRLLLNDNTEV